MCAKKALTGASTSSLTRADYSPSGIEREGIAGHEWLPAHQSQGPVRMHSISRATWRRMSLSVSGCWRQVHAGSSSLLPWCSLCKVCGARTHVLSGHSGGQGSIVLANRQEPGCNALAVPSAWTRHCLWHKPLVPRRTASGAVALAEFAYEACVISGRRSSASGFIFEMYPFVGNRLSVRSQDQRNSIAQKGTFMRFGAFVLIMAATSGLWAQSAPSVL